MEKPTTEEVSVLAERLSREAKAGGYNLNPDLDFTLGLVEGLAVNEHRYGYVACPCRRATGTKVEDLDVICPCDYRDADLAAFGACYCALYVSDEIAAGNAEAQAIPERRPPRREDRPQFRPAVKTAGVTVWRCRVCGYLCARETPPEKCPICKVSRERFEPFPLPPA